MVFKFGLFEAQASGYVNESESDRNKLLKEYKETIDEKQCDFVSHCDEQKTVGKTS